MLYIIFTIIWVGLVVSKPMPCCEYKMVGMVNYTLVDNMDTTKWGCKDNCVYSTQDGVMVCFKAGEMPVTCQDGENELEKDYTEIWTATGEVPNKLAEAPPAPLYLSYNGKKVSPNDTVATDDMLDWPTMKWKAEEGALYTIILIDFGIKRLNGLQYFHWIRSNVPNGASVMEGDEVSLYSMESKFVMFDF